MTGTNDEQRQCFCIMTGTNDATNTTVGESQSLLRFGS
jgi:hypothetical protein